MKNLFGIENVRIILSKVDIKKNNAVLFLLGYYFLSIVLSFLDSIAILLIASIFTNSIELPNQLLERLGIAYQIQNSKFLYYFVFIIVPLQILFKYYSIAICGRAENFFKKLIQAKIFENIINSPWYKSSSIKVGEAASVTTTEIFGITKYFGALLLGSFSIISACIVLLISLFVDWKMLVMVGVVSVPAVIIFRKLNKILSSSSSKVAIFRGELGADITDRLNGLFQIKTQNNNYHIRQGLLKQNQIYEEENKISNMQALLGVSNPVLFLLIILLIYACQNFIMYGQEGSLTLILGIAALGAKSVMQINAALAAMGNISRLSGSVGPIIQYLSLEADAHKASIDVAIKKIVFENVSLKLGVKEVVSSLNFTVERGSIFAIRGRSGVGKTTLANLIAGIYSQFTGEIYFYDFLGARYSAKKYRPLIAYVTQDIYLFSGSVRDSLLNGSVRSDYEIWDALKQVGIDQLVIELGGLDVLSRDLNKQISGGQRRRLGIARGMLTGASIFVLDEITSGLDDISSNNIYDVIQKLLPEKIIILVSHDNLILDIKNITIFELAA